MACNAISNAQVVHLESMGEVSSHHLLCELLPDVGEVGGVPGYHTNVARIALKHKMCTHVTNNIIIMKR